MKLKARFSKKLVSRLVGKRVAWAKRLRDRHDYYSYVAEYIAEMDPREVAVEYKTEQ